MADEPFLSRWARRKRGAARADARAVDPPPERESAAPGGPVPGAASSTGGAAMPGAPSSEGVAPTVAPAVAPAVAPMSMGVAAAPRASTRAGQARDAAGPDPVAPPAPLPDPSTLTPASDFSPFMRRGVDAVQRNAALRRLFTDPHFNTMDGLDVYIDDYGAPDPIPPAMLAALRHAHGLLRREDEPDPPVSGEGNATTDSGVVDIAPFAPGPGGLADGDGALGEGATPAGCTPDVRPPEATAAGGATDVNAVQDGLPGDVQGNSLLRGPSELQPGE